MTSFPGDFLGAVVLHSIIVLVFWFSGVKAATEFDFGTLTLSSLKLLGDAHLCNNTVRLTKDLDVPTSGAGKVLYAKPVRFRQPASSAPASFSTFFSFSVINLNPSSIGGGLAFVITPEDETVGDGGAYMGIMGSKGPPGGVVAVEFDTLMDLEFGDVNGNHIGLDLGSMVSTPARDLDAAGVNLKSGDLVNSWIDYSGSTQLLNISVSYSNLKPKVPFLSIPLNLGLYVNDFMFVGFSGSTQGSTEIHSIEWWSFTSSFESDPKWPNSPGPPPPPPTATLMNPTANSVPAPPPSIAPSESSNATTTTTVVREKSGGKCHNRLCKHRAGAVVGVVTAGTFCLAFAALALVWFYSKKLKSPKTPGTLVASDFIKTPKEFTYKNLKSATKGFDPCRIIGHGAFGTVYKGILPENGEAVAVKRCSHSGGQGKTEFLSELSIIATLRHRNLVRLQGWCHERGEILLVYDLMPNGSLDKALFESRMILPWHHRLKILLGVASALAYLHQECESQVIHRDIKTSNIMLDETFNAKVGDFGLARTVEHDKSPDATVAAGTMGYLAPEYLSTGRATEKTDVFSYGAVVLEVASGRRPIEKQQQEGERRGNLVEWVWNLHREERLVSAADWRLEGEFDEGEMRRVLLVGLACSHPDPMARPTMRSVVQMLVGETDLPFVPRVKPSMSFTTSHLLETLQDSVSDLNGMIVFSPSPSSSERNSFIAGGAMDIV